MTQRITINGDPLSYDLDPLPPSLEQRRAISFFKENPDRRFYWDVTTHSRLSEMDAELVRFAACYEVPRYRVEQHELKIDGVGPHTLLFRKDWHARAILEGNLDVPPGIMIFPNYPIKLASGVTAEEQELAGQVWWAAWEAAGRPYPRPNLDPATGSSLITMRDEAVMMVQRDPGLIGATLGHFAQRVW